MDGDQKAAVTVNTPSAEGHAVAWTATNGEFLAVWSIAYEDDNGATGHKIGGAFYNSEGELSRGNPFDIIDPVDDITEDGVLY